MISWPDGSRALADAARVARLATGDALGNPHVVPICYVLLDDRICSVVDEKPKRRPTQLKRSRNLRQNARAAVLVDLWDEDWARLAWVMMRGRARLDVDGDEYAVATAALRAKYDQYRAIRFSPRVHPLIVIDIDEVLAWRARPA